jgi:hypothetical protein
MGSHGDSVLGPAATAVQPNGVKAERLHDRSAGSMKPGKGALVPIAPGFSRWKGTAHTMRSGKGSGN